MQAKLAFLALALWSPALAQPPGPKEDPTPWNVIRLGGYLEAVLNGDLWAYHIRTRNTYHTASTAAFTEFTARLRADLSLPDHEWIRAQVRVTTEGVYGRPDNWTAPSDEGFKALVDLANLSLDLPLGEMPLTLTAGIQEIEFGDGFLIYDFYSEKRAIWTTAIRSAPALRATLQPGEALTLDLFAAQIHKDRISSEAYLGSGAAIRGGGRLFGGNARIEREDLGETDVGLFFKDERISARRNHGLDPDSDTLALSLRHAREFDRFSLSGEIVKQWGRTRVVHNAVAPGTRRTRDAWGGNLAATYRFGEAEDAPYARARYVHFSGDGGGKRVQSFDPFFYGFQDWGTWFLGDMTSFSLTNTNSRVVVLEVGATPIEEVKLRLLLFDFTLDRKMPFSSSRAWGREANLIVDWYPQEWLFVGSMIGAAAPGKAAKDFYGSNETQLEWMGWVGLTF